MFTLTSEYYFGLMIIPNRNFSIMITSNNALWVLQVEYNHRWISKPNEFLVHVWLPFHIIVEGPNGNAIISRARHKEHSLFLLLYVQVGILLLNIRCYYSSSTLRWRVQNIIILLKNWAATRTCFKIRRLCWIIASY